RRGDVENPLGSGAREQDDLAAVPESWAPPRHVFALLGDASSEGGRAGTSQEGVARLLPTRDAGAPTRTHAGLARSLPCEIASLSGAETEICPAPGSAPCNPSLRSRVGVD